MYLVYDMREEKIVDLSARIFGLFLENIDASDRERRPSELISILSFGECGYALVVRAFDGGHIYRFSDLADITDGYELKTYERYEIETRLHDRIISLYAVPLFGREEIIIADNIEAFTEWNGSYYI